MRCRHLLMRDKLVADLSNNSLTTAKVIICHECNNRVRIPSLKHRQKATCPRCGFVLLSQNDMANERILAFSFTALIFLGLSLCFDFLGFSAGGQEQTINIIEGIQVLINQDYLFLAIIQLLAIVILPGILLIGLIYVLLPLQFGLRPYYGRRALSIVYALLPWSMAEIFLVGVLVSLIKISSLADIAIGPSFYAYVGFTLCMTATVLHMDKHHLFALVSRRPVHSNNMDSSENIQRTWALLFTSIILYIPANVLPIMNTRFLGVDEPSTILGGVIVLWKMGSFPIAIVIFVASVVVPVGKLIILIWLNYSVQKGTDIKHNERIFWYRVTEFIGRWSMVDVFVVAVLVSLIQLGNTMSIYAGPAALAFCGVVILTMLAAMNFDTRLIWNETAEQHDR